MTKYKVPDDCPFLPGRVVENHEPNWTFENEAIILNDRYSGALDALLYAGKLIEVEEPKSWPQEGDDVWCRYLTGRVFPNKYKREDHLDLLARGRITRTEEEGLAADRVEVARAKIENYARETWGEDWRGEYGFQPFSGVTYVRGGVTVGGVGVKTFKMNSEIIDKFIAELDVIRMGGRHE